MCPRKNDGKSRRHVGIENGQGRRTPVPTLGLTGAQLSVLRNGMRIPDVNVSAERRRCRIDLTPRRHYVRQQLWKLTGNNAAPTDRFRSPQVLPLQVCAIATQYLAGDRNRNGGEFRLRHRVVSELCRRCLGGSVGKPDTIASRLDGAGGCQRKACARPQFGNGACRIGRDN